MKVTRLLHTSVNVEGRLEDTVAFYRERLGLDLIARPEIPGVAGHWLRIGATELHLVDAPSGPHGIQPTGNHYCVAVDDLDAAIAELDASGVEHLRADQGDVVQVWITDPAGNTIELQQDPG